MAVVDSARAGLAASRHATIVQLRAPGLSVRDLEREATELLAASPVPVVISARCDVALATGAAGVNLPERDLAVRDARALLGQRIVGRSVHSVAGAQQAERDGADYVIFGPVWPSRSHPAATGVGLAALAQVARSVKIPVIAIGGVSEDRVAECLGAGAAGCAGITMFES